MFKARTIITAVDIGTSKIRVLVGSADDEGDLTVIGQGEVNTGTTVVKGEVTDMDAALELLSEALEAADASSGRLVTDSSIVILCVSACRIKSYQGIGNVFIKTEDQRVTEEALEEAVLGAQLKQLPGEQLKINSFDSCYLLDGVRRVRNPIDQVAQKLEAYVHVIYGDANQLATFQSLIHDVGFDENVSMVFSGMADAYGILTNEEQEQGVLLVNIGAGTTEYVLIYNMGVWKSGYIPVGMEHLANDLALGLNILIQSARKIIADGTLQEHIEQSASHLELKDASGKVQSYPMPTVEKIVDLRLREIFDIIKSDLTGTELLRNLGGGGVLAGGGALFDRTQQVFHEVFDFPVRIGSPFSPSGALTDIENPRYSTVWGALKYGEACLKAKNSAEPQGFKGKFKSAASEAVNRLWNTVSGMKRSVKF